VKSADSALYAAKDAGRDGYWVATAMPEMPSGDEPVPATEESSDDEAAPSPMVIDGSLLGEEADHGTEAEPTDEAVAESAPEGDAADVDAPVTEAEPVG
jgi:hypothetical protein